MITVCIESPLAGDFARNIAYARSCLRFCVENEVSAYASHLLLTQVYNDLDPEQREAGISYGLSLGNRLDERWYFIDLDGGVFSAGMKRAAMQAPPMQKYKHVTLGDDWRERYIVTPTPGFGA